MNKMDVFDANSGVQELAERLASEGADLRPENRHLLCCTWDTDGDGVFSAEEPSPSEGPAQTQTNVPLTF